LAASLDPYFDPEGLSARAVFTLDTASPTELRIDLTNTSTGAPAAFSNADQILTGISFDLGAPGYNGDPMITGGTVFTGPSSYSLNFNHVAPQLGPGEEVTGEWGYGNQDGTGLLPNFATAEMAQATAFGGTNLDGPVGIDGPQAGLASDPPQVPLGGLGAVIDTVVIRLTLDRPLSDLSFLEANGVRAEFAPTPRSWCQNRDAPGAGGRHSYSVCSVAAEARSGIGPTTVSPRGRSGR